MDELFTTAYDGHTFTIRVIGGLDFHAHRAFRSLYEQSPTGVSRYVVDLLAATRLDSSALGMLLLLRDYAGSANQVELLVGSGPCRRVLDAANFDMLFKVT